MVTVAIENTHTYCMPTKSTNQVITTMHHRVIIIGRISDRKPKRPKNLIGYLSSLYTPIDIRPCFIFIFSQESKYFIIK
jgi:hypothetical protein